MKLIVGLSGASGSIYSARLLYHLLQEEGETYLVTSPTALQIFAGEYQTKIESGNDIINFIVNRWTPKVIKNTIHHRNFEDVGSDIASGSNSWDAMIVIPSSMKTIASINSGISLNLIDRAADVCLKESRKLIIVPRETPYNRIHLKNMLELSDAGAIILPASPGYYQNPKTLEDLGDFIADKVFKQLGFEKSLYRKWEGKH